MPEKAYPQRKSPRLSGYDYASDGAYFVTVCTYERYMFFGDVIDGVMILDPLGELVHDTWLSIPTHKPTVSLDYFVVMPNHFHGIVIINNSDPQTNLTSIQTSDGIHAVPTEHGVVGTRCIASADDRHQSDKQTPHTLGNIIGHFKASVTRKARRQDITTDSIWQSRYHDHIIRSEETLNRLRQYVLLNPATWSEDTFYNTTYL